MTGRARAHAQRLLERNVEAFRKLGYRGEPAAGALEARLDAPEKLPLRLRMIGRGRFFGGSYVLEVSTAEPVLPATGGLRARGRGVVRMTGVTFAGSHGDERGERLARRLEADTALANAVKAVHFERIRVDGDGRVAIEHMGGSVVWVLFPPLVRPVPLVDEQARALVDALDAFTEAGAR